MLSALEKQNRRKQRARTKLRLSGKPRLSVFRSGKHVYCQVIDDVVGETKASASSLADMKKETLKKAATKETARKIGVLIAERATKAGVIEVVFDKGPYRYHGQVKEIAEGAREGGLKF